jgi:hypothetical protein
MLHQAMQSDTNPEVEEEELGYMGFNIKGVPVSLGVMAYCKYSIVYVNTTLLQYSTEQHSLV